MRRFLPVLISFVILMCAVSCDEEMPVEPKPFCNIIVSNNSGKDIYQKVYKLTDEIPEGWTHLSGNIYPEPGTEYRIDYCYVVKTKTEIRDNELVDIRVVSAPESLTFTAIDGVMRLTFLMNGTDLTYTLTEKI